MSTNEMNTNQLQVFISSISASCTQDQIEEFVTSFGHYSSLKFNKRSENLNNSTASVTFKHKSSFDRIIQEQPFFINGVKLKVEQFARNEERVQIEDDISKRRIYVKNIPFEATDEEIHRLFSSYGLIETCYICKQKRYEGSVTDYGFVTYVHQEDARKVLENGTLEFPGHSCSIFVNEFKAKGHAHKKDSQYWKNKYENEKKIGAENQQARRGRKVRAKITIRDEYGEKSQGANSQSMGGNFEYGGQGFGNQGYFQNNNLAFPNAFYGFGNQYNAMGFQNMNYSHSYQNGGKFDALYQRMFMKFTNKFQTAVNFSNFCDTKEPVSSAWMKISEDAKTKVTENHKLEENLRFNWM